MAKAQAPAGGEEQTGEAPAPNEGEGQGHRPPTMTSTAPQRAIRSSRRHATKPPRTASGHAKRRTPPTPPPPSTTSLIQTLCKGLGLIKDDDGEAPAPDAEALAAQVAEAQTKATRVCSRAGRVQGRSHERRGPQASRLPILPRVHRRGGPRETRLPSVPLSRRRCRATRALRWAGCPAHQQQTPPAGLAGEAHAKAEMSIQDAVSAHYRN